MSYVVPKKIRENAKKGLELRREHGVGGFTTKEAKKHGVGSGVARATALKQGRVSLNTVKRMNSFFSRHSAYKKHHTPSSASYISWMLWGGDEGREWAAKTLKQALEKSVIFQELVKARIDDPKTPAPKRDQKKGSAKNPQGSASDQRGGIKLSEAIERGLKGLVEEHNKKHTAKSKRVNLGMLKAVFRRGAGAYSTSHRLSVTSRNQWAYGRVHAFLKLVRTGKSKKSYFQDDDLLPTGHVRKK